MPIRGWDSTMRRNCIMNGRGASAQAILGTPQFDQIPRLPRMQYFLLLRHEVHTMPPVDRFRGLLHQVIF